MTEIKWENPEPTEKRINIKAVEFANALMSRPDEWALYKELKNNNTARSCARYLELKYGLETTTRGTKVYARFAKKTHR